MDCTLIINNEGFQLIADFGILEDKDMFEMVKCVGNHTVAAGCVNVGVIQVKKLQALCYWVCDQQKHGQGITQDDWDHDTEMATIEKMHIKMGQDTGNVSVMDLGKFKTHETVLTCWHKSMGHKVKILSILSAMSLFPLSLSMMPKGTCITYPLQARLTVWTISWFTIC
jgi:hypothetical protein